MIKTSFDFDGTLLSNKKVQDFASKIQDDKNFELWIHTRRFKSQITESREVYAFALAYNIPDERVVFTNREYKYPFLQKNDIDIHLDDDVGELAMIDLGEIKNIICTSIFGWEQRMMDYIETLKIVKK